MIYVQMSPERELPFTLIATRRLSWRGGTARPWRNIYLSPQYPGMVIQVHASDQRQAEIYRLFAQGGVAIALYSGPEENNPQRWLETTPELRTHPPVYHKLTLFRPEETSYPAVVELADYLAERWATVSRNP